MAVRYVEIGQYPDVRREVRGKLSEILVAAANPGTYAAPEDVTGCFLEMGTDGKWDGASVGTLPKATADALYASGALANLATGATYRDTSGTQYTYGGAGAGWGVKRQSLSIQAPQGQEFEHLTVSVPYGFTERFEAPRDAVGFDVLWFSSASAGTLVATAWGIVGALSGAYSQANPAALKISGVDIANATIPAGANAMPTSFLVSDFVAANIAAGTIVEIRSNTAGSGRGYRNARRGSDSYLYGGKDSYSTERTGTIGGTGDVITGNPSITCSPASGTSNSLGCCVIRWYSESGAISVLECGDSLTKGEAGFAGETGQGTIAPLHLAEALNPLISAVVFGRGGQQSAKFHATARSLMAVLKPTSVVIPSWSPNDGVSAMDASINQSVYVCSVAISLGITPYLKTPLPWSYTSTDLEKWQAGLARVREICTSNPLIRLLDVTATLEDPSNPGNLKPEYFGTASDAQRLHPNPAGKWAQAQVYAAVIN